MSVALSSGQPLSPGLTHAGAMPTQLHGFWTGAGSLTAVWSMGSTNADLQIEDCADIILRGSTVSKTTVSERCTNESTMLELLAKKQLSTYLPNWISLTKWQF